MGLFNLFKRDEEWQKPPIEPQVNDVLLRALLNREIITREKALTLPAVSGAVDLIGNMIASMPVKLYMRHNNSVEEQIHDVRPKLLNGDTGDTLDAFQLKKAMVEDYLLGKGGYCYIHRKRNEVISLHYVQEHNINIIKNCDPILKEYLILVGGNQYKPYEFVKVLRNTKDGASGVGLTQEISKTLEAAYATLVHQLSLVKSGGNKKGFLKAQRRLGQEEIDTLKRAWRNMYVNNSENVVVLNNGLEFQESSNSSVEMQLDQNKNTLAKEINKIFHIDEDFDLTFKEAIYPVVKAFETALNRDLLLEREKGRYFFEFDIKEITKASLKERYEAYKIAKETGFLTLNEIRKYENLNAVEGLDVINVGLSAVLYDTGTHKYYTPNTGTYADLTEEGNAKTFTEKNNVVSEQNINDGGEDERDNN